MRISSKVGRGRVLSSMYSESAVFRTWSERCFRQKTKDLFRFVHALHIYAALCLHNYLSQYN